MGDIWSFSFRSQLDPDSEDSDIEDRDEAQGEDKAGGAGARGNGGKETASREKEELALLDLGSRAGEEGLVVNKTPWTIAKSNARPKNPSNPLTKSIPKKTVPPPLKATSSSKSSVELSEPSPPSSAKPADKQKSINSKNRSTNSPSSSKRPPRASKASSNKIEPHTPAAPKPVTRKKSRTSEASGPKLKRKKSSEKKNPAKKVISEAGKITFGRIPAGATADSNFPILQAFEHQAKTKPPRVETVSPPPPPLAPAQAASTSRTSKPAKSPFNKLCRTLAPVPTPPRPSQPVLVPSPRAQPGPNVEHEPFSAHRSCTPPCPQGFRIPIVSSSPASSSHTFTFRQPQPLRAHRPLQLLEDEPSFSHAAAHPPSFDVDDDEPFFPPPMPPPAPMYQAPEIPARRQDSPEGRTTYGTDQQAEEDQQTSRGPSWSQTRIYEQGGMVPKTRRLGSSKPTKGWMGADASEFSSSSSSSSPQGKKRRFKPPVPVGGRFLPAHALQAPPVPSSPPPSRSRHTLKPSSSVQYFRSPSPPSGLTASAYFQHRPAFYEANRHDPSPPPKASANHHPAFDEDRRSSFPVRSTLPPNKKKRDQAVAGITELGRFRLPSFVPQPSPFSTSHSYTRSRAATVAAPNPSPRFSPSGSSSATVVEPSERMIKLWVSPPPCPPRTKSPVLAFAPSPASPPPPSSMRLVKPSGQSIALELEDYGWPDHDEIASSPPRQRQQQQQYFSHRFLNPHHLQQPSDGRHFW